MLKDFLHTKLYGYALAFVVLGILIISLRGFLGPVFSGEVVLPQSFSIGRLTIHYYGVILATAVFVARFIALRRAEQYGITIEQADQTIFICIIAGILGARLYHVASEFQFYFTNPRLIFAFWRGGLSIYGGLMGGGLALAVLAWRSGWSWAKFQNFLNWLTFSFLAGQIIGRFGNLFNYEAFGGPTELPWKMFVPGIFRPTQWASEAFFHPWFLYESLANLVIFFILLRWKRDSASLFLWYVVLYNIVRLLLEFLRVDSTFIGPLRLNVLMSAFLVLVAGVVLIKVKKTFREVS